MDKLIQDIKERLDKNQAAFTENQQVIEKNKQIVRRDISRLKSSEQDSTEIRKLIGECEKRLDCTEKIIEENKTLFFENERLSQLKDQLLEKQKLDQIMEFCREIDEEKQITRRTYLADGSRRENDAEHAWHMAVMTLLLSEYSNESIDVLKTISMLLIHDLVEVYAGDAYCYDEKAKEGQHERELEAADRLFSILPKDLESKMRALWDEFEACESPEARFAYTMDHFQPVLLNRSSGGKSWKEDGIKLSQVLERNQNSNIGSEKLWEYSWNYFIKPSVGKELIDDVPDEEKPSENQFEKLDQLISEGLD